MRNVYCLFVALLALGAHAADYDVVLAGGRVMDPETGLDAVRNVAIKDDTIVAVTEEPLTARTTVDATGLIVAPGFIDLHVHGQTHNAHRYQVRDGVTTALELEAGMANVRDWIASKEGHTLVNFGASASHATARSRAMSKYADLWAEVERLRSASSIEDRATRTEIQERVRESFYESVAPDEITPMTELLESELQGGALGVGLLLGYLPGATREEIFELFEFTGRRDIPIFVHTRDTGISGLQEVIANAAVTTTPMHIVHMNSIARGQIGLALSLVDHAQQRGLDITTEVYPYTAASTSIESSLFDDGWQERRGISYGDLQWVATGERLTEETYKAYRATGGTVIIHMMQPEWIEQGLAHPVTIVASDGMPYAPGAHPRSAGTFSRVLGRYSRDSGTLDLMQALAKMTLMPARRLEVIAPAAARKGRLQVGMHADITVFDPNRIIDTATFEGGLSYSEGIEHVFVNGVQVVRHGETIPDAFPGRPLLGRFAN